MFRMYTRLLTVKYKNSSRILITHRNNVLLPIHDRIFHFRSPVARLILNYNRVFSLVCTLCDGVTNTGQYIAIDHRRYFDIVNL